MLMGRSKIEWISYIEKEIRFYLCWSTTYKWRLPCLMIDIVVEEGRAGEAVVGVTSPALVLEATASAQNVDIKNRIVPVSAVWTSLARNVVQR